MLYPLTFHPIFKERIWGGRNLERLYQKALPPNVPVGESWEISDRPGDESVIANGPLAGKTLHWLMENHATELMGKAASAHLGDVKRFPLLIKILDAQQKLSLQVHPPAALAPQLGGEPKTEMWYVSDAGPNADLFVGLKNGVTREAFEKKIADQTVADCFHRIAVKAGDAMFLPSGRVHALGAENVIFEIQQNSDTTYRVFDWNRLDASGKPRELHVAQSLASIDFNDFEPPLLPNNPHTFGKRKVRPLVANELFNVRWMEMDGGTHFSDRRMSILAVLTGELRVAFHSQLLRISAGGFCLIPAAAGHSVIQPENVATFLEIHLGTAKAA
jgi:mannose-6-phosphate isomerase